MYSLKQAPRAWYDTLTCFLRHSGFQRRIFYPTLFWISNVKHLMLVKIYVNDIIFGSIDPMMVTNFAKLMLRRFRMSMNCELSFFLRLQVKKTHLGIFIHQEMYISELLKKYSVDTSTSAKVPMGFEHKIFLDWSGEFVDQKKYRRMVGSLIYLTSSRLDILFAKCHCAQFQVNPKMSHLLAVNQIFRYLKGTKNLGIWLLANESFLLQSYSDSNYVGLKIDRQITSGDC